VGVIVDSSKKRHPSVFVGKWNAIQEPFCGRGNHKWNLVRKFFVSGKFWNNAKSAMRLDVPATWNIVSGDAWHDSICGAKIRRKCVACFAFEASNLMPRLLLVCCQTSMQHGCAPGWQNAQGPSIVKGCPAFPGPSWNCSFWVVKWHRTPERSHYQMSNLPSGEWCTSFASRTAMAAVHGLYGPNSTFGKELAMSQEPMWTCTWAWPKPMACTL